MALSRSPAVRRLRTRGTAGIADIFLSPLTTEEASSSSVDMEEHTADSLQRVSDDIEDYSQLDVRLASLLCAVLPQQAAQPFGFEEHLGFEKIAAAVVAYQNFYQEDTASPKDLWEQTSFLHAQ
ncbi:unnamed protein product, partial [Symbiodinium necroappetens]